ncbi:hypothetical protein DL96DRAFT_1767227 [Flagelloscypha sp. PMI_526]|nr:hypothetical protein DL96DRAFT_1767227 [Flagelloscypha sp. PMI_526]
MVPNPADKAKCVACETDKPSTSTSTSTPSSTTNGVGGGFNWGATASGSSSSTSGGGFNWSAAGMKAPEKKWDNGNVQFAWFSNPADKFKCVACETDKPSSATSTSTPAPKTNGTGGFNWGAATGGSGSSSGSGSGGGFNWSAAGMKAPETKPGQWNCSTCMVPNPATALKCDCVRNRQTFLKSSFPPSSTPFRCDYPAILGVLVWRV